MKKKRFFTLHLVESFLIFFFAAVVLLTAGTYIYFANTLVSRDKIMNNNDTGVVLLDRNGTPFFTFYQAKNKEFIPIDNVSPYVGPAVVSVEDKEFYQHIGFSIKGILRAAIEDVVHGKIVAGGSTITQQLVKNALLDSKQSFLRKYQELVLAREIERRYSKKQILEMYINSVYFGQGAFGIEEAAKTYFNKDAKKLTLAEASFLAGILPAPSFYSPYGNNLDKALERQKIVLKDMENQGYINRAEYNRALSQKLEFTSPTSEINIVAPHFAVMIRDFLIKKYGEEAVIRGGFRVTTTLDLSLQKHAEQVVKQDVAGLKADNATNGAAVVMDVKTRQILSMVGSDNWNNNSFGKINMALAPRQTGSSFKPIVYATAFEDGAITNATPLHDVPTTFLSNGPGSPPYRPTDYDKRYRGIVLPRRALANSLNIPSVEVMSKLSVPEVLDKAKNLGITTLQSPSDYGLSLVLGTADIPLLEMTNVYATLADNGIEETPVSITLIKDKNGNVIYRPKQTENQVFTPEATYLVTNILSDNKARAEEFGNLLTVPIPAAVKTGTTENYRDAWTLGYTPYIAVGVWVGNSNGDYMDTVAGSLGAAPIWKNLIMYASEDKPKTTFSMPPGIVIKNICMSFGSRSDTATTSAFPEYFIEGTVPNTGSCIYISTSSATLTAPTPKP